jgi:uncharacterized repeat protein (TIGR01451 family)
MSRGLWFAMNARTRKSLTLLWTALFVFSLALQSVALATPAPTLAVHSDGLFEMDGNAVDQPAAGDDWQGVYNGTDGAFDTRFIIDPVDSDTDKTFTGGSTKDDINISSWLWKNAKASQAKNDITHAFAAAYTNADNETIAYFGLNKWEADGNNFVGFWFLKQQVGPTGTGNPPGSPFSNAHSVGDILVLASYTNGGAVATFDVYKWVGTGGNVNGTLQTVASGVPCTGAPAVDFACGATNAGTITAPWPYQGRDGVPGEFPAGTFFEGGINLSELGLDAGCFSTFFAETRSSASVDATLSDFANGEFSLCIPPHITTQVINDQGLGDGIVTINSGESVKDTVFVGGSKGPGAGTVDFYVCGPTNAPVDCNSTSHQVGTSVTLGADGKATSAVFKPTAKPTVAQPDYYCFLVKFSPAAGSKYLADSHTNSTTECVKVIPADVRILKTPNAGTASAGEPISFTLKWGNVGEGKATGVVVSDNLPAGSGLNWSIASFTLTGSTCLLTGAVGTQVVTCDVGSINGNTPAAVADLSDNTKNSGSVTLTSGTTAASCAVIDNTGKITSDNDGTNTDPGKITVLCPDVNVVKTPNDGQVNAGDPASFSIKVTNAGPGAASGVTLSDPLPAGLTWSLGTVTGDTTGVVCGVTGNPGSQSLDCSDTSMASGDTFTVTVTTTTSAAQCATYPNTATVDATNESNAASVTDDNTDDGLITVNCPNVQALKTADKSPVNAGDQIGFTVTIKNIGVGTAYGATGSDTLPSGIDWTIDGAANGWSIAAGVLSFGPTDLAPNASAAVHIVGTTTAADCGVVPNTVTVDATNESNSQSVTANNSASASITVDCPDVQALKVADKSPVNAGDQIGFTVTIKNNGTGTAYGATGSDTLPAGIDWTIDGAANGWSIDAGVLSFGPADLTAGAARSVHIVGTTAAADCGEVPNTVTVDATNESNDASVTDDNSASASITVNCPDIRVVKTATDDTISAGEVAEFSIVITNIGQGTAYDVSLTDTLPGGVDWHVDSVAFDGVEVADPAALCTVSGINLSCPALGDLAVDGEITIMVSGDTNLDDCGPLVNSVTVDASNEPTDTETRGNNTDSATVVVDCPALAIDKDADHVGPVVIGDDIGFTVTIKNNGAGTAFGVTVSDTLDSDFTWSIESADTGWTLVGDVLSFSGNLAAGADSSVHVTAPTTVGNADQCGEVPNTAVLDHASIDPTPASASETVRCPEINIVKGADDNLVEPGQTVTFSLDVQVVDGPVTNGVITDTLPVGQTYVAGSAESMVSPAVAFTADEPTVSADGRTLTWEFPILVTGDPSLSIRYDVTIDDNATTATQTNHAEICVSELENCDTSDENVTPQLPDIQIVKTAGDAPDDTVLSTEAGPVTYTYVVTNTGPLPLHSVTVIDDAGTPGDATDDFAATCPKTTLAVDESMTCTFTINVTADTTNVAVAHGVTDEGNPVEDNDDAVVVIETPGIHIVKTAGDAADGAVFSADAGPVTYTYVVSNTGPLALSEVTVTDDAGSPGDTSDDFTATCPKTTLAVGESMTCTFTIDVAVDTVNVAVARGVTVQGNPVEDNDNAEVVVVIHQFGLIIDKTNDAPLEPLELPDGTIVDLPTADEGETVTYTLAYTLQGETVTNGVITDVLPVGVTYVDGSASNNAEFSFQGYDDATRTLTWRAESVSESGSVTYQATIDVGAAELDQPLVNIAAIDSDQTVPNDDDSPVYVPTIPAGATATPAPTPKITLPPTDTLSSDTPAQSNTGFTLMLILLALAAVILVTGFVTPVPASVRERERSRR